MNPGVHLAEIAALVGDPARANMLAALMDGRALTASELAYAGHISPQTASSHLGKLTEAKLLLMEKQGRHRYFRLASPHVAQMIEAVTALAAIGPPRYRPSSRFNEDMRTARTCYDHLAGRLGVALSDALVARGMLVLGRDAGELTPRGAGFLAGLGIDLDAAAQSRRVFCRPCLDWSERRMHLAGSVGAALKTYCFDRRWIERKRDSRAVLITPAGIEGFAETFGISL